MAQQSRDTYVSRIREAMDAESSARWSDTIIVDVLGMVFVREWTGILNAAPYTRAAQRTVTTDANGQFTFASLNSGSGDTAQLFYRLLSLTDGEVLYQQVAFPDVPMGTQRGDAFYGLDRRYVYPFGEAFQVLPVASGTTLTATVNYTPTSPADFSAGTVLVDIPDEFQRVLIYDAAGYLLAKGGTETQAGAELRALAEGVRRDALADLVRRMGMPMSIRFPDSASEWAG